MYVKGDYACIFFLSLNEGGVAKKVEKGLTYGTKIDDPILMTRMGGRRNGTSFTLTKNS